MRNALTAPENLTDNMFRCINFGSISAIATTMLESHVGFWSAYLLPLIMFGVGSVVLVGGKKRYIIKKPQGGVIGDCFRALWIATRNGGDMEKAKLSSQKHGMGKNLVTWDDTFIDELKTALGACKVFLFFPIYWVQRPGYQVHCCLHCPQLRHTDRIGSGHLVYSVFVPMEAAEQVPICLFETITNHS